MPTNQTPEALAEEIMRAASAFAAAKLALYGRQDPSCGNPADLLDDLKLAINRLRDMAVSGAKDAERLDWLQADGGVSFRKNIDAASAATKRGGA